MPSTLVHATPQFLDELTEELAVRGTSEVFVLFPLGSQYEHHIKRRLEECGVVCIVADAARVRAEDIERIAPKGLLLSGGPVSVYKEPPPFDRRIFDLGIPTLAICLGFQLAAEYFGYEVVPATRREFGSRHIFRQQGASPLFYGLPREFRVVQSHGDFVRSGPGLMVLGSTDNTEVAAAQVREVIGVQFHPEVAHTEFGRETFENFCFRICGATERFGAEDAAEKKIREVLSAIAGKRVLVALSGGTDSSTVMWLIKRAIERGAKAEVLAVYIAGVDRADDRRHVEQFFGGLDWCKLKIVDATARILAAVGEEHAMAAKRKPFRSVYHAILQEEADADHTDLIAQGTLWTDISESGALLGAESAGVRKATIKVHHNAGQKFRQPVLEPLHDQMKDTVRAIGTAIGVSRALLHRHPFPGPGRLLRVEGKITREMLAIEGAADAILIEELRRRNLYDTVWQAGAVVTSIGRNRGRLEREGTRHWQDLNTDLDDIFEEEVTRAQFLRQVIISASATESIHTCSKGDDAVDGRVALLSAVRIRSYRETTRCAHLPDDLLRRVSQRITNEVRDVGAVVFSLSDTPIDDWREQGTVVALWAVWSTDGFTAEWASLPFSFLRRTALRITREVSGVSAVVVRISSKPPATIEWG